MRVEVLADSEAVAARAASLIANDLRDAVRARGRAALAVSGGVTPPRMFDRLVHEDVPWAHVHVFQVDERVVPASDAARNLDALRAHLLAHVPVAAEHIHAMPVEDWDLDVAAARYAGTLEGIAGTPPALDIVHLGLGDDGHTASLVPGDGALDVVDATVAMTAPYRGHRRMTLTFAALAGARSIVWVVSGAAKRDAVRRLCSGDRTIPAGCVARERALLIVDVAAAPPDAAHARG
ncbi:MAG: 6-phosphogluconolactonase [Proteobacteria bacterium]|nr:6-phosphogluconolactonase [Pseudomonadota bacterium]